MISMTVTVLSPDLGGKWQQQEVWWDGDRGGGTDKKLAEKCGPKTHRTVSEENKN